MPIIKSKDDIKQTVDLYLQDTNLSELPEYVTLLNSLTTLNISNNSINSLPDDFEKLKNLTHLYFDNNNLTELPDVISKLTNLTVLSISKNMLTKLPEWIDKLPNLNVLDVSDNNFTEFPYLDKCQFKSLRELKVSGNSLKNIPSSDNVKVIYDTNYNNTTYFYNNDNITLPYLDHMYRYVKPLETVEILGNKYTPTLDNLYKLSDIIKKLQEDNNILQRKINNITVDIENYLKID